MNSDFCRFAYAALILLLVGVGTVQCRELRRDPETGRIRILYFGDAFAGPSPYPIYENDPLTTVVAIKASGFLHNPSVIKRHMRVYMPRSRRRLFEGYDMIVLSDANIHSFRTGYFTWFREAVIEQGFGLVMIGGLETFGTSPTFAESWGDTVVADVLPVICLPDQWEEKEGIISVATADNPFINSLPFDEIGPHGVFHGCNIVGEREGVRPLAYYEVYGIGSARKHPLLSYWEVGEGASYAMTADWTPAGGREFLRWEHYANYALNLAMYVCGGNIPQDITLVYKTRSLMEEYRSRKASLEETIEFVSKFGARMTPAERILAEAENIREEGNEHYLVGEMDDASQKLVNALDRLDEASKEAYELRDQALFWVYVSEWLAVASTGMVCGFILWTLMVRRRVYHEVGETKLKRFEGS